MTFTALDSSLPFSLRGKRVWVAGHRGLVGSAIVRRLAREHCDILTASRQELDLTRQEPTERWMEQAKPDVVVLAAARVGGILANHRYPVDFLYDNIMIGFNVMKAAHGMGVEKLLWLGSSCIYPREAEQPIREDALLTGPLEPTNEAYAIAKIAGAKLAEAYHRQQGQSFVTLMPSNLYGANDNFDLETSHVLPALIRKIHESKRSGAQSVTIWGTGTPRREFLHVDDLADAVIFALKRDLGPELINVGSGHEISIAHLATLVARIVGFEGRFDFDTSKPDGTPRKVLDTSRLQSMGWKPTIELENGIRAVYRRWTADSQLRRQFKTA